MTDAARQEWMKILANAPADALATAFAAFGNAPEFTWLRAPEFGAVMVRGRMGGAGAPFNLGETSVTRCSLRLADGATGHAYIAGRDREKARIAALCDALLQGPAAERLCETVIDPIAEVLERRRADTAARAAATQVDFFTLVRGES